MILLFLEMRLIFFPAFSTISARCSATSMSLFASNANLTKKRGTFCPLLKEPSPKKRPIM